MDVVDGRDESKNPDEVKDRISQLSACVLSIIMLTESVLSIEAVNFCTVVGVSSLAPKRSDMSSVDADEGGGRKRKVDV